MTGSRIYSLLGLATRARATVSGEFSTEKAVKEGKARLVIVAADASDNTRKQFSDMCTYYKVLYREYGSKEELGHAMGKQERASLAVTDQGFADSLIKLLNQSGR